MTQKNFQQNNKRIKLYNSAYFMDIISTICIVVFCSTFGQGKYMRYIVFLIFIYIYTVIPLIEKKSKTIILLANIL